MEYDYDGILRKAGRLLCDEDLSFDDTGCCNVFVNNKSALVIRRDEGAERIVLATVVASELPDPIDYSLVIDLMTYALLPMNSSGPAVGLDPESGFLAAYLHLPMKSLDEDKFATEIGQFLEFQEMMSDRISSTYSAPTSTDHSYPHIAV